MGGMWLKAVRRIGRAALLLAAAAASSAGLAGAARAQAVDTGHIVAELAPQTLAAPPGGTVYVALSQKLDRGWHTYWRNPGDAGEPPRIKWTLPPGWTAGDIVWATPQRLPLKTLMDYGYTGQVVLPIPITIPASARPGETATLKAAVAFLVCEAVCIPEDAVLTLRMKVADGSAMPHPTWGPVIDRALAAAPKPAGLKATWTRQGDQLKLAVTGAPLRGRAIRSGYFYPFESTVIDHPAPQGVERGQDGLTFTLKPGYAFRSGKPPAVIGGVIDIGGQAYEVNARQGALPPGARGQEKIASAADVASGGGLGLPLALGFAFLGGVVLNLMPCVFPVLSMKAAALTRHAHQPGQARSHGLAFGAGVLLTFLALAGVLIAARAGGEAVGWGFQLQSPAVVAALCLLMLLVGLNLAGVFEVGAGVQGAAGSAADPGGLAGSALTGALAVVVAAPCTAPFMAGALGYALVQPPLPALLVFAALAIGFAAPFVTLAFVPRLLARLPRPGPWMETLRRLLSFPMFGAAAWLAWVFAAQVGDDALALLFAAAVAAALAAWLYGRAPTARLGGGRALPFAVPAVAAAAAAVVLAGLGGRTAPAASSASEPAGAATLASEAFTPERLDGLRAEGRPVLVNFTAAWCVTCKVNERLALSTPAVREALQRTGTVYLKADWTRRDPMIAEVLAQHGRAGVPLYLVYAKGGGDPRVLPQLLTEGEVVGAIEAAAS
jgi:thiol:disulfide interchange protein/DsbC/DsbD-like thiol-disulfide interchange protein